MSYELYIPKNSNLTFYFLKITFYLFFKSSFIVLFFHSVYSLCIHLDFHFTHKLNCFRNDITIRCYLVNFIVMYMYVIRICDCVCVYLFSLFFVMCMFVYYLLLFSFLLFPLMLIVQFIFLRMYKN